MSYAKFAAAAIVIAGGLTAFASGAMAGEEATFAGCAKLARQAKNALANQSNANEDAQKQLQAAADYCRRGYYKAGVAHYEAALKTLGATEKSS